MKKQTLVLAVMLAWMATMAARAQHGTGKGTSSLIRIPVVVHVLYNSNHPDIPDATIQSYITQVNKNLRGLSISPYARQIFDTLRADTEIELCLALKDPSGNNTTAITHTITTRNSFASYPPNGTNHTGQGGDDNWPTEKYMNVWIAPMDTQLQVNGCPPFIIGGFTVTGPALDTIGVILASNSITANLVNVWTHEIGHFLGLSHLEYDGIDDTPDGMYELYPTGNCPGYPTACSATDLNQNTSHNDGPYWTSRPIPIDPPDMLENFMNLDQPCAYMFTKGQSVAMHRYIGTHYSSLVNGCTSSAAIAGNDGKADGYFIISFDPNSRHDILANIGIRAGSKYEIYDLSGRTIMRSTMPRDQEMLPDVAPGVYVIRCNGQARKIILGL